MLRLFPLCPCRLCLLSYEFQQPHDRLGNPADPHLPPSHRIPGYTKLLAQLWLCESKFGPEIFQFIASHADKLPLVAYIVKCFYSLLAYYFSLSLHHT